MTVRLVPGDPQSVVIRFFDADGLDLDEAAQRKIERLYDREESRRVLAAEIGDIDFPSRTLELYTDELISRVDLEAIRAARFKLVLDYAFGTASFVMPNVLAQARRRRARGSTRCCLDRPGSSASTGRSHADRLGELVRSSGAHLGAVIGPDGEQLTLVDDTGHVLERRRGPAGARPASWPAPAEHASIAVPVDASWRVNEIAADLGAEVAWAKLGSSHLMDLAREGSVDFAANTEGGFVFPRFLAAFDAVATLVRLLGLLAVQGTRLSSVVAGLPEVHVVHEEVRTPFEQKGTVMRSVVERARSDEVVLLDGVKTMDATGWTLVVPDPEEAITHVYAEGDSERASADRAARAVAEINSILRGD